MGNFKVEVIADRSGQWCGNEVVFATCEDAEAYARDLAGRWTLVREWRVVEIEQTAVGEGPHSARSSIGGVVFTVTLGPITRSYRALCTTAPSAYDAGTSITIVTGPAGTLEGLLSSELMLSVHKQAPARVVLVEANQFEWHRARYSSGLYASAEPEPDLFGPPEIAAELLRRMDRGTPTTM